MRNAVTTASVVVLLCASADAAFAHSTPDAPWGTTKAGEFRLGAEALIWWFKDSPTPVPLVTDGLIGDPDTHVLLGGGNVNTGANPGFRITAGYGLRDRTALEANFFYIPSRSKTTNVASSGQLGSTDLILPYIDAVTGQESGTELSLAPVYAASTRADFTNSLLGAELNGAWTMEPVSGFKWDVVGGFRYLRLHETYSFTTSSPYVPPTPPDTYVTTDNFNTTNNFYGGQVGIRANLDRGDFFANGTLKVALGAMVQSVDISGSLVTNDFTNFETLQTFPGGYFAMGTNMGNRSRTEFAVVPEAALNLGWRITPSAAITVGYSFVYASNVVRPGNQMSRIINTSQSVAYTSDPAATLVGPAQPSFQFNTSSFWAQGINIGLAVRF